MKNQIKIGFSQSKKANRENGEQIFKKKPDPVHLITLANENDYSGNSDQKRDPIPYFARVS